MFHTISLPLSHTHTKLYYRQQQWTTTNQHVNTRRESYLIRKDFGQDKGLSSSAAFQTQAGRSTAPNQIHVVDTNIGIGPMRPSQFLEEKRWPPFETFSSQWKVKSTPANTTWDNAITKFVGETCMSTRPTDKWIPPAGNITKDRKFPSSSSDDHDLVRSSNRFKPEFEPPFRLQVNFLVREILLNWLMYLTTTFKFFPLFTRKKCFFFFFFFVLLFY